MTFLDTSFEVSFLLRMMLLTQQRNNFFQAYIDELESTEIAYIGTNRVSSSIAILRSCILGTLHNLQAATLNGIFFHRNTFLLIFPPGAAPGCYKFHVIS